MPDEVSAQPGMMDQISAAGNEFFGDALLGDQLDQLATEKPDLAKEILLSMDSEAKQLIDKNGQINRDALRKQLTLTEKFSLMAKMWIAENLSGSIMDGVVGEGKKIETTSFADTIASVKEENKLDDHNIYYPTAEGNMGKATMLWNLKGQVETGDESTLKFMTGSTLVMPAEDNSEESILGLDVTAALQIGLLKHGITLKTYGVNETIPEPGDKEIQIVFAPPVGFPMKADGTLDIDSVKKYAELYKREKGGVQWFTNQHLMAAVMTSADPTKIDENMAKCGLSGEEVKAQLNSIVTGVPVVATAPVTGEAAVVAAAPAEGAETTGTAAPTEEPKPE